MMFEVGIFVHTQEELDEVFNLIRSTYSEFIITTVKRNSYYSIMLPMVYISFFLLSGYVRGHIFDRIYYSDGVADQEKNEILLPMVWSTRTYNMRPISSLYREFETYKT